MSDTMEAPSLPHSLAEGIDKLTVPDRYNVFVCFADYPDGHPFYAFDFATEAELCAFMRGVNAAAADGELCVIYPGLPAGTAPVWHKANGYQGRVDLDYFLDEDEAIEVKPGPCMQPKRAGGGVGFAGQNLGNRRA
jgi:hypothetical protein